MSSFIVAPSLTQEMCAANLLHGNRTASCDEVKDLRQTAQLSALLSVEMPSTIGLDIRKPWKPAKITLCIL